MGRRLLHASALALAVALAACGGNGVSPETPQGGAAGSGTPTGGAAGGGTPAGGAGGSAAAWGGPVDLAGVTNARHTGGLPTTDGRHVRDRVLIRSGHLADLGATGCSQLGALQIRSVVDLRQAEGTTSAGANPDADCVTTGTAYYLADIVKLVPPSVAYYEQTLTAAEPKLAAIFGHIGHEDGLPAIVHCVIGRDRASIITALILLALGVSSADVVQDYLTNQEPDVQSTVASEYMQAIIDRVDAAGGIDAYLEQHGVVATQIAELKELALE